MTVSCLNCSSTTAHNTHLTSFSISTAVFPVNLGHPVPIGFVLHFYQKRSYEDK